MLEVIPAIDLIQGECVRLTEGRYDTRQVFSKDPVGIARHFQAQGARRLHVVDLEAARTGRRTQQAVVESIVRAVSIPVQLGGGLRTLEDIEEVFSTGVRWAILGTSAQKEPNLVPAAAERWRERILVALDARGGSVATEGWTVQSATSVHEMVRRFENLQIGGIIYTDIARDGRLQGPNLDAVKDLARQTSLPVIASGGISQFGDLVALEQLKLPNLVGVIVGKALYEGRIKLDDAIRQLHESRCS